MLKVELSRKDLTNLVSSVIPLDIVECERLTKEGLMRFTGNQWNEEWKWERDKLLHLSEERLYEMYRKYSS